MSVIGQVGTVHADLDQQFVGVTGLRDDVEAVRLEHAGVPLAQQGVIVGHNDAKPALAHFGFHDGILLRLLRRYRLPVGTASPRQPGSSDTGRRLLARDPPCAPLGAFGA